jgi:hypothetical protein
MNLSCKHLQVVGEEAAAAAALQVDVNKKPAQGVEAVTVYDDVVVVVVYGEDDDDELERNTVDEVLSILFLRSLMVDIAMSDSVHSAVEEEDAE